MNKKIPLELSQEGHKALFDAYQSMLAGDDAKMIEAIRYWRIVTSFTKRLENDNMSLIARDQRSLTRYKNVQIDQSVNYQTLLSLAEGWLGRIKQFPQTDQIFVDVKLTDALIDNALPILWDFEHDTLVMFGYHPIIAKVLRNKKQRKFLFIVDDSFKLNPQQNSEDSVYHFSTFQSAPPPLIVGNAMLTVYLAVAESLNEFEREQVKETFHQHQIATNTELLFVAPELENFISDFHTKVSHAISNKHINNCEDKDFLFISAGPSFMNDLNDILRFKSQFFICTVARAARALFECGITPDVVFTVDVIDSNYDFFSGLDFSKTLLFSSVGTSKKITSKKFKAKFFIDATGILGQELNRYCKHHILSGSGSSVSVQGLSVLLSFKPRSITITGQDLVYTEGERFNSGATYATNQQLYENFDNDATRYSLLTQENTYKQTSSDLKIFHTQIETLVAAAKANPKFITKLINSSKGGALIKGFKHQKFVDFALSKDALSNKNIDGFSAMLRRATVNQNDVKKYMRRRGREVSQIMEYLETLLDHYRQNENLQKSEKICQTQIKLNKLQSRLPLLIMLIRPLHWRLRENQGENELLVRSMQIEFYKKYHSFVTQWNLALLNEK